MTTTDIVLTEEELKRNRQAMAKFLLERKRETLREMREEYRNNPEMSKIVENLRKRAQIHKTDVQTI
jgi:hypothetical protein